MLTVISGNNRDGYPCALNNASQKEAFPLAGSLSLIFSSVKVTATGSAGVTVSMTSEDSAGYGKCEPGFNLAKVRKCNLINLLNATDSAFAQMTGKEKGPRPALRVMQLLTCEEANKLHHNLLLQATGNLSYSRHQHPNKTGAGLTIPSTRADIRRDKRFFCVRNQRCAPIMVGRSGGALALAGFSSTGIVTSLRLASLLTIRERGLKEPTREAAAMVATTQTRPEFIDTYWIIPEYETTPYGKVSFTRQDRRTFVAMFKDSRLIWAGRQPVNGFTENVKRTESPKLPVEGIAEGIEEISIPQGMVKITPPSTSTITEIVTVQGVAHV